MNILTNEQCCEVLGWKGNWQRWDTPDKQLVLHTPDFHNSLDACFKWIVPWLNQKDWNVEVISVNDEVRNVAIINRMTGRLLATGNDKSPSLAFIKAFTQMVREG